MGFVRILRTQCVQHVEAVAVLPQRRGPPPFLPGVLSSPIPEAFPQSVTGWKREFECGA